MFIPHGFLADGSWISNNWGWLIAAGVVVLGLGIFGPGDTRRFSLKRTWAISSVCFAESIRKRILWITPLAIIGVIGITQFQRAFDEQDAVRQSVKICLFATGLVVVLTSIILACTNIPKEIESRVVYTVMTKPVTRLELVLGKVIGFSRVALAMVVIMGIFTWIYMRITSEQKQQQIAYRLNEGDISDTERARLAEYQKTGLLTARSYWTADQLAMYGEPPQPGSVDRVIANSGDEDCLAGFPVQREVMFGPPQADLEDWSHARAGQYGLLIRVQVNTRRTGPPDDQPVEAGPIGPKLQKKGTGPLAQPRIGFELMDENYFDLLQPTSMIGGTSIDELKANILSYTRAAKIDPDNTAAAVRLSEPVRLADGTTAQYAYAWIPPQQVLPLFNRPRFFVRISGSSANVEYTLGAKPVSCFVPQMQAGAMTFEPPGATEIQPLPGPNGEPESLAFRGRMGIHYDQEMSGGKDAPGATAAYVFANVPASAARGGGIPFQISLQVDRSNSDVVAGNEDATQLEVRVIDDVSKKATNLTARVLVESKLPAFFTVPADSISSGDFQIVFHCVNSAQTVGLMPDSLQMVASTQWFELNLIKSLAIIWMMSILVIILSVLCSTFLSWPIALVLTVLLLLGHWGVSQIADSAGPGLGRQIVNDFKLTDVAISSVVSSGVDRLSKALTIFADALPDTSQFDAIGDIEQGVSISMDKFLDALLVLAGFGAPAIVVAYVIMCGKEVAP
jgi:hypothetical protein